MMKPLYTIVADEDINAIVVAPHTLQSHTFEVGSTEYDTKHDWLVANEYEIVTTPTGMKVLNVRSLQDPNGTPAETPEKALAEKLDEAMSIPVHAFVFHRGTLTMAGKEVQKKHVNAFAKACIKNYSEKHLESRFYPEDFAVFEVDFANKHVELKSINPEE